MERDGVVQLELFSEPGDAVKEAPAQNSFLNAIKGFEKIILISISCILIGIISFSIGVERGKRTVQKSESVSFAVPQPARTVVENKTAAAAEAAPPKQAQPALPVSTQKPAVKLSEQNAAGALNSLSGLAKDSASAKSAKPASGSYTVQLVSFKTKDLADKAAAALRAKGFTSLVVPKGQYSVVCVGKFDKKESALALQAKLKSQYHDCLIRRL